MKEDDVGCWLPVFSHTNDYDYRAQGLHLSKIWDQIYTWFIGKDFFEKYFMVLDERPHTEDKRPTNYVGFAPCATNDAHIEIAEDTIGKETPPVVVPDPEPEEPEEESEPEQPEEEHDDMQERE